MAVAGRLLTHLARVVYRYGPSTRVIRQFLANRVGRSQSVAGMECATLGMCEHCRLYDSFDSLGTIAAAIRNMLIEEGLPFIEHQGCTSRYEFYLPAHHRWNISRLLLKMNSSSQYQVTHVSHRLSENKYEVDGTAVILPAATVHWDISRRSSCKTGRAVLNRWKVQISFFSDLEEARVFHLRNDLVRVLPPKQRLPASLCDLWSAARFGTSRRDIKQLEQVKFPIDLVYTWVDDADPMWIAKRQRYGLTPAQNSCATSELPPKSATNFARYRNSRATVPGLCCNDLDRPQVHFSNIQIQTYSVDQRPQRGARTVESAVL